MKIAIAVALAVLTIAGSGFAQGLTPDDFNYLRSVHGLTPQSAVIAELTPNERQALHSAIDDLKTYPEGRDRQVAPLSLVYPASASAGQTHPGNLLGYRRPAIDP